MTPYQTAFLALIGQRDTLYLQLAMVVLTGLSWYRLWLRRYFNLALAATSLLFLAAWGWGVYQIQ